MVKLLIYYNKIILFLNRWSTCQYGRLIIVSLSFLIMFVIIGLRIVELSTYPTEYLKVATKKAFGSRKSIIDRNGNILAINLPAPSAFINARKILNPEQAITKLKTVLTDIDHEKILSNIKNGKNFVWVKRNLNPREYEEVHNLGIVGLEFEKEEKRVYTYKNLLSHVIGYVGSDNQGLAGLEKYFQGFLTNDDISLTQSDFDKPLSLSIDVRIQNIVNEELENSIKEFNAVGGVAVVANPNNGEILAMVAKPDFDPHYPTKASQDQLFNRASLGVYECGSVLKAITMAIGFDTKTITMRDSYDISSLRVANFDIKDYHKQVGLRSVPEIFYHSSNIGVAKIALEVGKLEFRRYLKLLGLMHQLKIELPERAVPLYPSDTRWSDLSTVTISYGYGLSISPLHFVQAMIPIVNGGYLYPLTLVKKDDTHNDVFIKKIFDDSTSRNLNTLLRLGVKLGTGKKADVPGYAVGGKSGTANILKANGKYDSKSRRSSFIAAFPAESPQYIIYLMLDNPKGTKNTFGFATAGWTAAPAVGKIIRRVGSLYGMQLYDEEMSVVDDIEVEIKKKLQNGI